MYIGMLVIAYDNDITEAEQEEVKRHKDNVRQRRETQKHVDASELSDMKRRVTEEANANNYNANKRKHLMATAIANWNGRIKARTAAEEEEDRLDEARRDAAKRTQRRRRRFNVLLWSPHQSFVVAPVASSISSCAVVVANESKTSDAASQKYKYKQKEKVVPLAHCGTVIWDEFGAYGGLLNDHLILMIGLGTNCSLIITIHEIAIIHIYDMMVR